MHKVSYQINPVVSIKTAISGGIRFYLKWLLYILLLTHKAYIQHLAKDTLIIYFLESVYLAD